MKECAFYKVAADKMPIEVHRRKLLADSSVTEKALRKTIASPLSCDQLAREGLIDLYLDQLRADDRQQLEHIALEQRAVRQPQPLLAMPIARARPSSSHQPGPAARHHSEDRPDIFQLFFDGGSRGNGTPNAVAGSGAIIFRGDEKVWSAGRFLGRGAKFTNNVAEYDGLILGLEGAVKLGIRRLHIKGDSQLVVKQVVGTWACDAPHLQQQLCLAREKMEMLEDYEIGHVPRDANAEADRLANSAMDEEASFEHAHTRVRHSGREEAAAVKEEDQEEEVVDAGEGVEVQRADGREEDALARVREDGRVKGSAAGGAARGAGVRMSPLVSSAEAEANFPVLFALACVRQQHGPACLEPEAEAYLANLEPLALCRAERLALALQSQCATTRPVTLALAQTLHHAACAARGDQLEAADPTLAGPGGNGESLPVAWEDADWAAVPDSVLRRRGAHVQYHASLSVEPLAGSGDALPGKERARVRVRVVPTEMTREALSCRVLRHCWRYRDRFLVVQADDDRLKLEHKEELLSAVRSVLVCGRRFEYLYDHDQKVHFFAPLDTSTDPNAPPEVRSTTALINWVGDFEGVKSTKVPDRISMAFTPTYFIATLQPDRIHVIDDVTNARYCFTDGVGTYGQDIQELLKRYKPQWEAVCAIQIRFGPAKGMLVLDPRPGREGVWLSKSMVKFKSSLHQLEVVEVNSTAGGLEATPAEMRLNVDIIQHLEHRAVPLAVLQNRVQLELAKLQSAFDSPAAALRTLKLDKRRFDLLGAQAGQKGSQTQTADQKRILTAIAGGLDIDKPPLRDWIAEELAAQRKRLLALRIPLPPEAGAANLFGVAVRDSGLGAGEVFVRLGPLEAPLDGVRLLVGRHPCNHPGDLQVVTAVASPAIASRLGHLHGVVVFPVQGDRPLPDMLGGGDLDGDTFWVISDHEIVSAIQPHEPMDYGEYTPKEVSEANFGIEPGSRRVGRIRGRMELAKLKELHHAFVAFFHNVPRLTLLRQRCADAFGAADHRTLALCKMLSDAHDSRASGIQLPRAEYNKLKEEVDKQGFPCWWTAVHESAAARAASSTARGSASTVPRAAATLFALIKAFQFDLPPETPDTELMLPSQLMPPPPSVRARELSDSELQQGVLQVQAWYYAQKRALMDQKKHAAAQQGAGKERSRAEHYQRWRRGEDEDSWAEHFEALEVQAFPRLVKGARTAEEIKDRVRCLYGLSLARKQRDLKTTFLKNPTVLAFLSQIKLDARVHTALKNNQPLPASFLFSPPPATVASFDVRLSLPSSSVSDSEPPTAGAPALPSSSLLSNSAVASQASILPSAVDHFSPASIDHPSPPVDPSRRLQTRGGEEEALQVQSRGWRHSAANCFLFVLAVVVVLIAYGVHSE